MSGTLNRRTALAGIASATLSASAIAAQVVAVDPVPALVAQYLELEPQLDRASHSIGAVWEALGAEGLHEVGPCVDAWWWRRQPHEPQWCYSDDTIRQHFAMYHGIVPAKGGGWRTVIDPREAQTIGRLREAEREWSARTQAAGIPALSATFGAISDAMDELADRIHDTAPTTVQGVLAKLQLARHLAGPDVERLDFYAALAVQATTDLERLAPPAAR